MEHKQFVGFVSVSQVAFLILYAIFADYTTEALPNSGNDTNSGGDLAHHYPMFQDVHVMIFVGFGFLMTFLRRYSFTAVGVNFLLACYVIEWALVVRGLTHLHDGKFSVGIGEMLGCDFVAAAVLISMGALLGKLSPLQFLIMGLIEVVLGIFLEHVVFNFLQCNDIGGSMVVHVFGAYFGLVISRYMYRNDTVDNMVDTANYTSDIFSMIGTIFLWVYWPSFNSAVAVPADARHRAVVNTYLAMAACCVTTFAFTSAADSKGRFIMIYIQNATLAGGVAIGTTANLLLRPWGASLVGTLAGLLSTAGFRWIQDLFAHKAGVHDSCGVHNLHGMPGLLAGFIGVGTAFFVSADTYGQSLKVIFPAMDPSLDAPRSAAVQALMQLASLGACFFVAIIGGGLTGMLLQIKYLEQVPVGMLYEDCPWWEIPPDYEEEAEKKAQQLRQPLRMLTAIVGMAMPRPSNMPVFPKHDTVLPKTEHSQL